MTDLRPQIAIQLKLAAHDHAQSFPHGDWRGSNERLGKWRLVGMDVDPATCGMGNDMCAEYLRDEWAASNG